MIKNQFKIYLLFLWTLGFWSHASPSIFPEKALAFSVGYTGNVGATLKGEFVLPSRYWDNSLHLEVYTKSFNNLEDDWGMRLSGNALLFPAIGTNPPLGLGLGADIGYDSENISLHAGPIVGTDLLFSLDLPATISAYLGVGYRGGEGISLSWSGELRYYLEEIEVDGGFLVLELATSDVFPVSLGLRWSFY